MNEPISQQKPSNLEEILNTLGEEARGILIRSILRKRKLPGIGFHKLGKSDLVESIANNWYTRFSRFDERNAFTRHLYRLDKEFLQYARIGQLNASVPKEILENLPSHALVYLYAGIWNKKSTGDYSKRFSSADIHDRAAYEIIYDCVMAGIASFEKIKSKRHRGKPDIGTGKADYRASHRTDLLKILTPPTQEYAVQTFLPIGESSAPLPDPLTRERYHSPSRGTDLKSPTQLLLPLTS